MTGRAGVVLFLLGSILGCDRAPRQQRLDIGGDTITLQSGVEVHDIAMKVQAGASELQPAQLEIAVGDVVRFTTEDAWTHALRFEQLPEGAAASFDARGQLRSPPLVTPGAVWVVSFEQAPPGNYRVVCSSHSTAAVIIVRGV